MPLPEHAASSDLDNLLDDEAAITGVEAPYITLGIEAASDNIVTIDAQIAIWMSGLLGDVQNLYNRHGTLPDGTRTLYPTEVLPMRDSLFPNIRERELGNIKRTPEQVKGAVAYILALGSPANIDLVSDEARSRIIVPDPEAEYKERAVAHAHLAVDAARRCFELMSAMSENVQTDNSA